MSHFEDSHEIWDAAAATFDNEPDHGLENPLIRDAWKQLFKELLPPQPAKTLDMGCGTGSLSLLLAELDHEVIGADFSPAMLALAEEKAKKAGYSIPFHLMNAAFPEFDSQKFEVIICRHVLWVLPNPSEVLQRWVSLLQPGGYLLLIEGFWYTEIGLHAEDIVSIMPPSMAEISIHDLSQNTALWGKPVNDERYAICARLKNSGDT